MNLKYKCGIEEYGHERVAEGLRSESQDDIRGPGLKMLQQWSINGHLWSVTCTGGFTDENRKQRISTQRMENVPHRVDLTEGGIKDQFRRCC